MEYKKEIILENQNSNQNNQRDYNKEPLIIKNNFIMIMYGFTFLLVCNAIMIYIVFFAGVIDWSNGEFFEILKNEMRNPRFSSMVIAFPIANIWAFIDFIRKLRKPEKVYLYNDKVYWDKRDTTVEKQNIVWIKKSIYPMLGKIPETPLQKFWCFSIGLIILPLFLILSNLFACLVKLFALLINKNYKFIFFCTIVFYDNQKNAVNVYLMTKQDYKQVDEYLLQNFNLQIEKLDKNYKFSK